MISTSNLEEAKKLIKNEKKPVIVNAHNIDFNRNILDYGRFDILLSPEKEAKKPKRGIYSGFDSIMAGVAAQKGISIGMDLEEIRSLDKRDKAERLAKIRQNVKICRKAGVKIAALNIKDKKDAFSLILSLGASTKQAEEAAAYLNT